MQPRHRQISTLARPMAATSPTPERLVEKPLDFVLCAPNAQTVTVAGTFNSWEPTRTPMRKDSAGNWKATVWLPPGRYEYRFVADGQWLSDPNAKESVPNGFGSANSVAVV